MSTGLPEILRANPRNRELLAYLERAQPSAHPDLVEELERTLETARSGSQLFCPDPARYAHVLAYAASGEVFALVSGMQAIALRVPVEQMASALAEGAEPAPELGADWLCFAVFSGDMTASRARLARWVALALQAG